MLFAYDTFLQSVVPADLAAQNSSDDPYRYECACCGEEVIIAAKHSNNMVAHFRHRSGNNDVDCEEYLGKYGLLNLNQEKHKNEREKIEFYFSNSTRCFYLGVKFNQDEISEYEKNNVAIEIRSQKNGAPFYVQKIDSHNFSPDYAKKIMIETYSPVYFVSNSFNPTKRAYTVFGENSPTFFKIQGEGNDFNAKLVRSDALYTGVRYFVVLVGSNEAQLKLRNLYGIDVEEEYDFVSMKNRIWASVITIFNKTAEIESVLNKWNYKIDTPESLSLLWPPSYEIDGVNFVSSNHVFLSSSFCLQPCGNINTVSESIYVIDSNITRIKVDKLIKILRKNVELEIDFQRINLFLKENVVKEQFAYEFTVPKKNRYYLFSAFGTRELVYGEKIILTPKSKIFEYENGHLERIIIAVEEDNLKGEKLLIDILKHYKVFEPYKKRIHVNDRPDYVVNYINNCEEKGMINSLVKKYIEEGKL